MIVGAALRGRPIVRIMREGGGHGVPPLQLRLYHALHFRRLFTKPLGV
jgi:hypothetical protein